MTVLVTAASRHGATQAISHEIALQLRATGHTVRAVDPVEVDTLDLTGELAGRLTRARGHRVFAGRLDVSALSRGERMGARRLHAASGDYRDWHEIRCWATGLASQIATDPDIEPGPEVHLRGGSSHGPMEE
jgi:menaquinone-dependent protoporphyrinogen oxidase